MNTKDPKYVDPRHFAPPYVTDIRNEVEPEDGAFSDEDYLLNRQFIDDEEDPEQFDEPTIKIPTSFDVVAQYVRPQGDGTFLVDVEIEIPDDTDVYDFEIRTAVQS